MEINEVKTRQRIGHYHLEVQPHPTEDRLIYNRILQSGSGDSIYGLRIARHIVRNQSFLDLADKIQTELQNKPVLHKSRYNANFFLGKCEICAEVADDCHHIKHQSLFGAKKIKLYRYSLLCLVF